MNELMKKMSEYEEMFGDSFPSFNFIHLSAKEICNIIDDCLKKKKDAYELGYAEDSEDIEY